MSYFGVSTRNGVGLGLGTVPSLTNTPLGYRLAPSLDLSFAGSDALSPAITFSRTTNATLTNSAGLIANAPMNLLTFSEQFDNAAWTKTRASISANTTTAPDGTTTADKFVEDTSASNTHQTFRSTAVSAGTPYTFSVYIKADGRNFAGVRYENGASTQFYQANVNLTNGTATTSSIGSPTGTSFSVTSAGDDWWRVSITVTAADTSFASVVYLQSAQGSNSYTGNGVSGAFLWGAQLELGSTATTYNPTTVKNLLGFTEHFDNAAWTKSNASISATKVDDIYGQPFAQKLVENTATSIHSLIQPITPITSTPYTGTLYVKAAERAFAFVGIGQTGNNSFASINLSTGAVSVAFGSPTVSATSIGNGWFRVSVTVASISTANLSLEARISTDGVWDNRSYTGDGTSGIYIFGAQLSDSASVDPYVYQPVAAPTSTAYYGPRFDYDPVTLAPKGLLIEEQRTQLLLNSSLAGTSLATQNVTVAAVAHTLTFYGTGTVTLSGVSTAGPLVGTGAYPNRATLTFTPTAGTLTLTVTGTVQFAQLEAGAFATSFIPSAASQVTRAADSASMIGNNFARWYNQTEGALFAEYAAVASSIRTVFAINDGTANESVRLRTDSTNPLFTVTDGGVDQANIDAGTVASNTAYKFAGAYALNSFAASIAGGAVVTDTSGSLPTVNRAMLGNSSSSNYLNGTISRIAYYNRRLANTELQGLTS